VRAAALVVLALLPLAACELVTDSFKINDFSGDPYPIGVETTSGALVVGLREVGVQEQRTAVLDLLSPITLVDPGPSVPPSVTSAELLVLGRGPSGELDLPRARLPARVLALHPCSASADPGPDGTCHVGSATAPRPFDAIIGADSLAGDAVRLRLGSDEIRILADIAGTEQQRGDACDAVFPNPYRGGGTMVVAGTELPFAGRRITMQTCLSPSPSTTIPQARRGIDALMLVSTAIGPSLLGEATYQRLRAIRRLPALESLPEATVFLPSGPITGRRATVDRMALVARASSASRAPCRHVYGHHLLLQRDCLLGEDCPCDGGARFCPVPAMVELAPQGGLEVLVIRDDDPTLQALRTELRPDQPEVDGILGTSALLGVELDVDYPHARVLARCTTTDCTTRPALAQSGARPQVAACIAAGPIP
jgi:hypothetical protein